MFSFEFIERLVKQLNSLVREAIFHGGDIGGPYYCNKKDLEAAMNSIIQFFELQGVVDVDARGDMLAFVLKDGRTGG